MIIPSLFVSAILATTVYGAATTNKPQVKDAPAAAHYGVPSFDGSQQYPSFNFPNFDVNYCSVHASFPLIGVARRPNHHHREKRQAYGVPAQDPSNNGYFGGYSGPAYGPSYFPRPRPFDRQGCRNTAIFSFDSCNTCCQIASRVAGNDAPTVGILMAFDPKLTAERRHDKDEELNEPDRAVQCVCCTARRV